MKETKTNRKVLKKNVKRTETMYEQKTFQKPVIKISEVREDIVSIKK